MNRKNFYGATDDRTIQDVVNLNATISHRFTPNVTLRNQTQYSRYTIDARESGPNNVGTITNGVYTAFPATNLGNTTPLPLRVAVRRPRQPRPQHHRHVALQPDRSDHRVRDRAGPASVDRRAGARAGHQQHAELLAQHPGQSEQLFPRRVAVDPAIQAGGRRASITGNRVQASATDVAPYINDTMSFARILEGRRRRALRPLQREPHELDQPAAFGEPDVGFTSVRAGVIYQPTETQSYYVSYGTSFNPSLETLALTNGQQSLDPETSAQYELGAKWDLMDGKLSLTSAIFQIEKDNTRSQISPGVYELTGNIRVHGFQASRRGPHHARRGRCSAATRISTPKSSRPRRSTARKARCPPTRRRTARRSGRPTTSRREWQAGTGVAYMSDRYASNNNAVKVPDYFRWDAMVAYQQPKYAIQLNVFNLDQPTELRRADSVRSRPFGARHRSPGDADVHLQVLSEGPDCHAGPHSPTA